MMRELWIESPLGALRLVAEDGALVGIHFAEEARASRLDARDGREDAVLGRARAQLAEYFAGERTRFDLPLRARGTAFQERVWAALGEIPFGATSSYGALARAVGRADAVRAVGAANGRNPLPIVVPCHRVIGSDGALTGYAGGTARKAWLLRHEAAVRAAAARAR